MAGEVIKSTISSSFYFLLVLSPETYCSLRNHCAPVQNDNARYQHSAYQQKCMKSASKTVGEKITNKKVSQTKRKLSDHIETSVDNETTWTISLEHDPVLYSDAMAHLDAKSWRKAIVEELEKFVRKELFIEVGKPKNCYVVGCKWIFKCKLGSNSRILQSLVGCPGFFPSRRY